MASYYPFGKPLVMTEEQIRQRDWKFNMYDKYGIPYGIIDESDEANLFSNPKNKDREEAIMLIMQGKEPTADLASRLLKYKREDNIKASKN